MPRVFFIFLLTGSLALADTFVAAKAQPWHSQNQISKWAIFESPVENAGFVEGRDSTGKAIRFPQPLIVAKIVLPSTTAPANFTNGSQFHDLRAQGVQLEKFLKIYPQFTKQLEPYLSAYQANIGPLKSWSSVHPAR